MNSLTVHILPCNLFAIKNGVRVCIAVIIVLLNVNKKTTMYTWCRNYHHLHLIVKEIESPPDILVVFLTVSEV